MQSFLDKIKNVFSKSVPDSEIIGDVKFHPDNTPYFTVKMQGCPTLVDINAEDIAEKFFNKFNSCDVKNATKIYMKYRALLQLAIIEKNYAIFHNRKNNTYQLVDLSDNLFLRDFDLDTTRPEDAFKLGIHFERMRIEKDKKLFNLTKNGNSVSYLKMVKSDGQ
jgi:hypothetical protein